MNGQANIMEYVLMTFFVIVVIGAIIFLLTFFQVLQFGGEQQKAVFTRQLFIAKYFLASPLMARENSVFDDAKLTALSESNGCRELEAVLGSGWAVEVTRLDSNTAGACTAENYPDCGRWSYCGQNIRNQSIVLPVNVYGASDGLAGIGIMKVVIYTK
ncbi:MAG: hypothetical protein HY367_03200 [Candidatus Aenigmarchaeota archaeon]|nr:hypothetical protein [Candidatus Aenigmarchaeota archaeon]